MKIRIEAKKGKKGYVYTCKEHKNSDTALIYDLAHTVIHKNSTKTFSSGNKFIFIKLDESVQILFEAGSLIFQDAAVLAKDLQKELNVYFKNYIPARFKLDQLIITLNNSYYFQKINHVVEQKPDPKQASLNFALLEAIRNNQYQELLSLLAAGADPACDYNKPLLEACLKGQVKIVKKLLSYAEVNPNTNNGYALRMVIARHNMAIFKLLLKHPKLNPSINDNQALKTACTYGYVDIVSLLLEDKRVKIIPYSKDILNYDCLALALSNGHIRVLQLLLTKETFKILPLGNFSPEHLRATEHITAVQKMLEKDLNNQT